LYKFAIMEKEKQGELLEKTFPKDVSNNKFKINQIEKCLLALPLIKVSMTAEVKGTEEINVGDLLNVKIRVDFKNLKKGEESGYVHSSQYPYLRRDSWFLIITDKSMTGLACVEKLDIENEFYEKELNERITRVGPINFVALVVNDSYKGLDQVITMGVDVTER